MYKYMFFIIGIMSILFPSCQSNSPESVDLHDIFPLKVGLQYSYYYQAKVSSYWSSTPSTSTDLIEDSGFVKIRIIDSTLVNSEYISWRFQETSHLIHHEIYSHSDSPMRGGEYYDRTFPIDTTIIYELREHLNELHTLELLNNSKCWNFPLNSIINRFNDKYPYMIFTTTTDTIYFDSNRGIYKHNYSEKYNSTNSGYNKWTKINMIGVPVRY